MKKSILILLFLSLQPCAGSVANTFHQSMSGRVDAVTADTITVATKLYNVTAGTVFRAHEKRGAAIYVVRADKSDIHPGHNVVVMANGPTALEVIIARWR